MTVNFEFITPTRILVGEGKSLEAGKLAKTFGNPAMVVIGRSADRIKAVLDMIATNQVKTYLHSIDREPTVEMIQRGVDLGLKHKCQVVIAIGGGSVLDAAKAISVLMTNEGEIIDYLEVIGKGKVLSKPGIPLITIPTTAGTGAEVTRNAVIGAPEHSVKVSLRSPYMLAKVAIIDPGLSYSMPKSVTASTGMDALTQLIEPFVSNQSNPLTDALCKEGMLRVARSLRIAYQNGSLIDARIDMALASMMSGLALANAKLGVVHGFASVLGGMLGAPHGAICARLLPPAMEVNVAAIQARDTSKVSLARFDQVAKILTNHTAADARDGVSWVENLGNLFEIPPLSKYGLTEEDFPIVIEKTSVASSTKGNPIQLTADEMESILVKAL
jgi:alcohol dehydrogenase class IV